MSDDSTPADIAIIGMACRAPGADSYAELWSNLKQGLDSITRKHPLTEERDGHTWVNAQGIVQGVADFDAGIFGIPRSEAEMMDPQQRLFLEVAADALADAGHEFGLGLGPTGVVAGVGENHYLLENVLTRSDVVDNLGALFLSLGNEKDHIATRVAYRLNLTGPALTVQTSCSTSLVAVHVGLRLLRAGDADAILVGGSSLGSAQSFGYAYDPDSVLSPDGRCRAFDAAAMGTVPGAGAAALVLRKLEDALRDGDAVHAVIKGSAINNDGGVKVGYTAPSAQGQVAVMRQALTDAEATPRDVGYVLTHGTGTHLGDAIELDALATVYADGANRDQPMFLGSLKPNLGHLDAAAGVANVVAAAMMVSEAEVTPHIHCDEPHPGVVRGLQVATKGHRMTNDSPLIGVSCFGLGGTNAHIILGPPPQAAEKDTVGAAVVGITGRTPAALSAHQTLLRKWAGDTQTLRAASATLRQGRVHREWRSFAVVSELHGHKTVRFSAPRRARRRMRVGLLFPGHGSQLPGILETLEAVDRSVRGHVDEVLAHVPGSWASELETYLWHPGAAGTLMVEQLAIVTTQYAMARSLLNRLETPPVYLVGHSIGECAAAMIAGAMTAADAVGLVVARVTALSQIVGGAMMAVKMSADEIETLLPDGLDVAVLNGPGDTVVSGPLMLIEQFGKDLTNKEVKNRLLNVPAPGHSRMVEPHLAPLEKFAETLTLTPPTYPWRSTTTTELVAAPMSSRYWVDQVRAPVRFYETAGKLDDSVVNVEVGVGLSLTNILSGMRPDGICVPLVAERDAATAGFQYAESLGELWAQGGSASLLALTPDSGRAMHIPPPPFDRERYWIEPSTPTRRSSPQAPAISVTAEQDDRTDAAALDLRTTAVRSQMVELWSSVLGSEEATDDDNFFALGGESALLLRLSRLITDTWGIKIKLRDLASRPTLGQMCALVTDDLSRG